MRRGWGGFSGYGDWLRGWGWGFPVFNVVGGLGRSCCLPAFVKGFLTAFWVLGQWDWQLERVHEMARQRTASGRNG